MAEEEEERERETDRQTDRQAGRQAGRQRKTETEKERGVWGRGGGSGRKRVVKRCTIVLSCSSQVQNIQSVPLCSYVVM